MSGDLVILLHFIERQRECAVQTTQYYANRRNGFKITSIALCGLAGILNLFTQMIEYSYLNIILGILSIAGATLHTVETNMGYDELYIRFSQNADDLDKLHTQIILHTNSGTGTGTGNDDIFIQNITTQLEKINFDTKDVPHKIQEKYKDESLTQELSHV